MGRTLASLNVVIGGDVKRLSQSLTIAQKDLRNFARGLDNIGTTLTKSLTLPVIGFGALAVKNFADAADAIAQVEAGIASTGGAAGLTSKELQEVATELQNISTFDDDEILRDVTAQLLTFTKIADEEFKKAQVAVLDLATRLKVDLKSATILVGKALNDPVEGLTSLTRAGVQFTEDQKKLIKSLVDTGQIAQAQRVILAELETQFGGSAQAAAKFGSGPIKQLANSLNDLTEDFGQIILVGLEPFIEKGKELASYLKGLDDDTKKYIVTTSLLAAAIGPVLIVGSKFIGFLIDLDAKLKVLTGAGGLATTTAGIIGLAVSLAFALERLSAFLNKQKEAVGILGKFQRILTIGANALGGNYIRGIADYAEAQVTQIRKTEEATDKQEDLTKSITTTSQIIDSELLDAMAKLLASYDKQIEKTKELTEEEKKQAAEFERKKRAALDYINKLGAAQNIQTSTAPGQVASQTLDLSGAQGLGLKTDPLGLGSKLDDLIQPLQEIGKKTKDIFTPVGQVISDAFTRGGKELSTLGEKLVQFGDIFSTAFTGILDIFTAGLEKRKQELDNYYQRERAAIEKSSLTEEQKQAKLLALEEKVAKEKRKIARKEAAANKAKAIFEAIINGAAAVVKALANPVLAAVIGALAAAQIAVIAATPLPALAKGGIAYGDSIVRVGEYPNARVNPEVIAPLSDLRALLGGVGGGELSVRLSGDDLLFVLERAQSKQFRRAGR